MESSRSDSARRKKRLLLARGPFVLLLVFAGFVGALAGFFLALGFDPFAIRLKETPFGPDRTSRIPKGASFDGLGLLRDLPREDQAKYREALRLAAAGETAPASTALDLLASVHGGNPLVTATAAYLHLRPGPGRAPNLSKASALLEAAQAKDPSGAVPPWTLYVQGLHQESAGRPDSAFTLHLRAVRLSPQFAYAHAAVGRLQLERGETGLAANSLRKAIGLMTTHPERYRPGPETALPLAEPAPFDWLATLYMQVGAVDSARMALEYGTGKGWRTDRMTLVQGWLWETSGFLTKADSVYRDLLAKEPGNADYARALATLGWKPLPVPRKLPGQKPAPEPKGGESVFAVGLLDPLARQYPGNGPLWMALGQAYHHRGLHRKALEAFDAALLADPSLPGLREKRDIAQGAWARERALRGDRPEARRTGPKAPGSDEEADVVLPGAIALLGAYSVAWGATPLEVRQAYPDKRFRNLPTGDLLDEFVHDGVSHQYLLAFKDGRLWGVRVFVTDSSGAAGDIFGRYIRVKSKISGEGKGTGEASCPGYLPLNGAIWETDDTFEFMAQFQGKENQVRLARMDRQMLPHNRRLCDLVVFLQADTWEKGNGPPTAPPPPKRAARPKPTAAPRRPDIPPMPDSVPSIVMPPGVDPFGDAPDITD